MSQQLPNLLAFNALEAHRVLETKRVGLNEKVKAPSHRHVSLQGPAEERGFHLDLGLSSVVVVVHSQTALTSTPHGESKLVVDYSGRLPGRQGGIETYTLHRGVA